MIPNRNTSKKQLPDIQLEYQCKEASMKPGKVRGRDWCTECQREVVDLRRASTKEIEQIFDHQPEGLCATFTADQLGIEPSFRQRSVPQWLGVTGVSLMSLLAAGSAGAQSATEHPVEQSAMGSLEEKPACEQSGVDEAVAKTDHKSYRPLKQITVIRVFRRRLALVNYFPYVWVFRNIRGRYSFRKIGPPGYRHQIKQAYGKDKSKL